MHPIDAGAVAAIEAELANMEDRAKARACVLTIGEHVEIKGGTFRVAAMGKRFVRLEGIPGARFRNGAID